MSAKCIDIVLASYNGADYIKEQLDSIMSCESYNELINEIIISDDCSVDDTVKIINEMNNKKIKVVENKFKKGPVGNFSHGLSMSTAQFVMLSDQDDVWFKDKLLKFYNKAQLLDANHPGVIYSNLMLVDKNLNPLGYNFFENENIAFDWGIKTSNLFFQNVAPGCAMLLNRKCIERINPLNDERIMMHDWWALMFAAIYGNVHVINEPLVKYRQHGNNAVGATINNGYGMAFGKFKRSCVNFHKAIDQLKLFYSSLSQYEVDSLSEKERKRILFFDSFNKKNFLERVQAAFDNSPYKSDRIRDIVTRLYIIWG